MLVKRKFENYVGTYGDQSISGKKTFTENLVVTGECTLPDDTNLNITFDNSSILQSAIVSTSGWITDMYTTMYAGLTALLAPKANPTFTGDMTFPDGKVISRTEEDTTFWKDVAFNGTLTFPDESIDQAAISSDGWITNTYNSIVSLYLLSSTAANTYATKANPTFTGELTFRDTSTTPYTDIYILQIMP